MKRTASLGRWRIPNEEPTVNLTPLIDVVFVILIMFIVIAPLLELDHVQLADAPTAPLLSTESVKETSPIVLHVHHNNTIFLNERQIYPKDLVRELKEAKQTFPGATPQVFHDREAQFGVYQQIKNSAEEAGFSQIDIILKPS